MGKAGKRRMKNRARYLGKAARASLGKFEIEWNKRLESWIADANSLADKLGFEVFKKLIRRALDQLKASGEGLLERYGEETVQILIVACSQAVARVSGKGTYRLQDAGRLARREEMNRLAMEEFAAVAGNVGSKEADGA